MRFSMISLSAIALATVATPAFAQETAPPSAITISGSATVVSDYRFRGISQTDKLPAIQGGFTLTHESGVYVSVWSSSVNSYLTATATGSQELDLIGGYKHTFSSGTTFDVGATYYIYPRTHPAGDLTSSNFIEPYASISQAFGPVTGKVTVNYAPKQKAVAANQIGPRLDNFYLAGDLSAAIPQTPLGLSAHLGHTWGGPSWLSPTKEYTDWAVGATLTFKALTLGVSYVEANKPLITPTGKNASKGGIVGSIGVSF